MSKAAGSLAGKVALITGGASGLGLGMAQEFLARGATVVIADRAYGAPAALAGHPQAFFVRADVTDESAIDAAFSEAERLAGPLDIAIVNAGISQRDATLDLDFAAWRKVMAVNLDGAFLTAQAAGKRMLPRKSGVILFMSSIYGIVAGPERLAYVVSKSGVSAMAKALALEWSPHGLRVNAMAPGYVRTPLLDDLINRGKVDPEKLLAHTPMGRFVEVAEIARLAAFLASDEASATTGHIATADGGWTANGYL